MCPFVHLSSLLFLKSLHVICICKYTDFSTPIDRTNHLHLVNKLSNIEIHNSILSHVVPYLNDRSQCVIISCTKIVCIAFAFRYCARQSSLPIIVLMFNNSVVSVFKYSFETFCTSLNVFLFV